MPINVYKKDFQLVDQYTPQVYMGTTAMPPDGTDIAEFMTANGYSPGYCAIISAIWSAFDHAAWGYDQMPNVGNSDMTGIQFAQAICETINSHVGNKLCELSSPEAQMNTTLDTAHYCDTNTPYQAPTVDAMFRRFTDGSIIYSEMECQLATYAPIDGGAQTLATGAVITASTVTPLPDQVFPIPYADVLGILGFTPPDPTKAVSRLNLSRSPMQTPENMIFPPNVSQYGGKGDQLMPSPTDGLFHVFNQVWHTSPEYQFQEGGVVPPTPNKMLGFIYDSVDFPTPDVKFPPFNTRVPFQNYARAVPAVFIKRK